MTDVSNAARTILFNIHTLDGTTACSKCWTSPGSLARRWWSQANRRHVRGDGPRAGDSHRGHRGRSERRPVSANAALKGNGEEYVWNRLLCADEHRDRAVRSRNGLLTTVGWKIGGKTVYALEGSAFNAGSAINWLRDGLSLHQGPAKPTAWPKAWRTPAASALFPAFTGLGAPCIGICMRAEAFWA